MTVRSLSEITLDADEFERITATIINRLRDQEIEFAVANERQSGQDLIEPVVIKDDLITWYLENYRDGTAEQSDAAISQDYEKIAKVVDRMVTHDMSLIVGLEKPLIV